MQAAWKANSRFLSFKTAVTDFEFNTPILKKGVWILNDFEKNSTDFEGFGMDFEKYCARQVRSSRLIFEHSQAPNFLNFCILGHCPDFSQNFFGNDIPM